MKVYLIGYPGDMGGANTEAWHLIKLWRSRGVEVDLVPTWGEDKKWEKILAEAGCKTHHVTQENIRDVPGLRGSVIIGICNSRCLEVWGELKELNCRRIWMNCMTFLYSHEFRQFAAHGTPEAMVYQSQFQMDQIDPSMVGMHRKSECNHLIRGAFDFSNWSYKPVSHEAGSEFWVGRVARPDERKWSSSYWPICNRIQYPLRKVRVMGVTKESQRKLGHNPEWANVLAPMSMPVEEFYGSIHASLCVNGGAKENWPRVGLEAMAVGVPVVTEDNWGWQEMIEHGVTGYLGGSEEHLAHCCAMLAWDEELRMKIAEQARHRLENDLANPDKLWDGWKKVFESIS